MGEEREEGGLSALLHETRTFPPPDVLAERANARRNEVSSGHAVMLSHPTD